MFCFGFVIVIFAYSLMYLPDTIVGLGMELKIENTKSREAYDVSHI